jgi:hypothetical protein
MKQERLQHLEHLYRRGFLTESFMASDFFREVFQTRNNSRPTEMQQEFMPAQNRQGIEQVAMISMFQAGRFAEIKDMLADFNRWIEDGVVAKKELEAWRNSQEKAVLNGSR